MNPINETEHGVQGPRTDGPSRRSVSEGVADADGEVLVAINSASGAVDDEVAPDNGNEANGDDDPAGDEPMPDERWALEELQFAGAEDESLNRYVYGVERDEEGELYVLVNTDFRPDPATGELYKIVPADEGEEVPAPEDVYVVGEEVADDDEQTEDDEPDEIEDEDVADDDEGTDPDADDGPADADDEEPTDETEDDGY